MQIGNSEITREMMPALQAKDLNPDHVNQGIQDILAMVGGALAAPAVEQQPADDGDSQWH